MSNVHVASAANEVAQALPSTATVTVSKHGIQAIETLNLDAQTATDKSLTWSRTFSGMEILTNPILQLRTKTTFSPASAIDSRYTVETVRAIKKAIRPRSDPIANAASSVNVTINNASMAIQPSRDHRLVNTTYPDEPVVANQRTHYGLNQLDEWAEPYEREFSKLTEDDVEFQFNNNALRQNYPSRVYGKHVFSNGSHKHYLLDDSHIVATLLLHEDGGGAGSVAASANSKIYITIDGIQHVFRANIPNIALNDSVVVALFADGEAVNGKPIVMPEGEITNVLVRTSSNAIISNLKDSVPADVKQRYPISFANSNGNPYSIITSAVGPSEFNVFYDLSQPLAHPYFRDNVMRDNTLVNVRYFDCQITLNDINKLVEANHVFSSVLYGKFPKTTTYTTTLVTSDFSGEQYLGAHDSMTTSVTKAFTPRLIFDLVTPSVPLPTISDKVVSTFHTMTSPPQPMVNDKLASVKSGNIQLSQIPDKIYVFCKSSFMDTKTTALQGQPSTRLGVCTNLRIRTPQNSAFLIEMDQESLYQMSCRNGSKQSRSAFMCTLGSVVCIDPEKDLGGYTNGVLLPYTFDVQADFTRPGVSNTDSIVWRSDVDSIQSGRPLLDTTGEQWTLFVVCELHGHLYLMSDGTGKQTKSNLTVTEVADAVAEGLQHPATIGNGARSQKMDAGVLAEVARAGDSRDALRS